MELWDMIAIIAVAGIVAEVIKTVSRHRAQAKSVSKGEMTELRDAISKIQADLEEIKANLSTVVIQMDDLKSKI